MNGWAENIAYLSIMIRFFSYWSLIWIVEYRNFNREKHKKPSFELDKNIQILPILFLFNQFSPLFAVSKIQGVKSFQASFYCLVALCVHCPSAHMFKYPMYSCRISVETCPLFNVTTSQPIVNWVKTFFINFHGSIQSLNDGWCRHKL